MTVGIRSLHLGELISGREAARRLNVSHETVYRWEREGRLKAAARMADRLLFDAEYIDRYSEQLRAEKKSA